MKLLFPFLFLLAHFSAFGQFQAGNSGSLSVLNDVFFFDAQVGIAVGDSGTILRSTNGGLDWTQIPLTQQNEFRKIGFFNDSTGLVVGKELMRTTDKGLTWTLMGESPNHYYDLEILDGNIAFISSPDVGLIRTQDMGQTWDTLQLVNPNDAIGLMSFVNDTLGFACRRGNAPNGKTLKTTDGGLTWGEWVMNSGSENSVLEAFEFLSADVGFIGGWYNAYLAKTVNGGTDWAFSQNNDSLNNGQVYDFCFPAPDAYYACGWHNLFMKSTDGGLNWDWINPDLQPTQSLKGIYFLNDSLGWVVGSMGTILIVNMPGGTVGLDAKEMDDLNIQVYPNPSAAAVTISYPIDIVLTEVRVFGVNGQQIGTFSGKEPIQLGQAGNYYFQIQTNKGLITKQVVIY